MKPAPRVARSGIFDAHLADGHLDGIVKGDGAALQRALGAGVVQRVVDTSAFHHQAALLAQHVDGLGSHVGEAGSVGALLPKQFSCTVTVHYTV